MKRPTLTFFQANELCKKLLPIGDAIWMYAEQLRTAGYSAFDAYSEFLESFGDRDEIELHRLCAVELAKLRLGQPWPMKFSPDDRKPLYSSSLLKQLQEKRDAQNGCTRSEIDKKYPGIEALWRREIDPCHRNKTRFEISERSQYQLRWNACMERQRLMIEMETQAHSPVRDDQFEFEMEHRFAKSNEVMGRDSATLGFSYDRKKSREEFPVFSKQLTENWDLCWTLQHTDMFALTPIEGSFAPNLDLRGANIPGDADKARTGEFLLFRYQHIVPGFGSAYWKFRSLNELERVVKAHLCMYRLMAPILESSVISSNLAP
jgi:hypothetical protein